MTHLLGNVPGHVDMALELIHPDLGHAQRVPAHMGGQVLRVGLVCSLNVGNPGAGQHLHAPSTLPHLPGKQQRTFCTAAGLHEHTVAVLSHCHKEQPFKAGGTTRVVITLPYQESLLLLNLTTEFLHHQ